MLACIACSKQQLVDAGEDTGRGDTASTKPAVKSLTSQIKDVVLKLSGSHRQSRSGYPKARRHHHHHRRSYGVMHYDNASEGGGDDGGGSSGITNGGGGRTEYYPYLTATSGTPARDINVDTVSENGKLQVNRLEAYSNVPVALGEEVDHEPKEWVAQVEPGVHITFLSLTHGGNDLKRIRFDREMFNKWQAQKWWGENYDRIMELYNVQTFNTQAQPTSARSEDDREPYYSRVGSRTESSPAPLFGNGYGITTWTFDDNSRPTPMATNAVAGKGVLYPAPDPTECFFPQYQQAYYNHGWGASFKGEAVAPPSVEGRTTTSSREESSAVSISNASDNIMEATEWVEEDEPGVFVTIRQMADGTRDLRRVRFSRERFGEVNAKQWWEENRERIHAQYL